MSDPIEEELAAHIGELFGARVNWTHDTIDGPATSSIHGVAERVENGCVWFRGPNPGFSSEALQIIRVSAIASLYWTAWWKTSENNKLCRWEWTR